MEGIYCTNQDTLPGSKGGENPLSVLIRTPVGSKGGGNLLSVLIRTPAGFKGEGNLLSVLIRTPWLILRVKRIHCLY